MSLALSLHYSKYFGNDSLHEELEPEPEQEDDLNGYVPYRDDPSAVERGDGFIKPPSPSPYSRHSDTEIMQVQEEMMDGQFSSIYIITSLQ
jgi:hypothetical protein